MMQERCKRFGMAAAALALLIGAWGPTLAAGEAPRKVCDVIPEDVFFMASVRDVPALVHDYRNSKLGKIFDDPAFKPIFDEIRNFYHEQIFERYERKRGTRQQRVEQFFNILGQFDITKENWTETLPGELTFVVFEAPFGAKGLVPDMLLAADLRPETAAKLRQGDAVMAVLGDQLAKIKGTISAEKIGGVQVNTLAIANPQMQALNIQLGWAVVGDKLVFSNRTDRLKKIIKALSTGVEPPANTWAATPTAESMKKALEGQPRLMFRLRFEKFFEFKDMIAAQNPPLGAMIGFYKEMGLREFAYGLRVDDNGLVRETYIALVDGKAAKIARPLPDNLTPPPAGTFAWMRFNMDAEAWYKMEMQAIAKIPEGGQRLLNELRDAEKENGFSVEKDIVAALDGYAEAYAAIPFNDRGQPVHFVPDVIVSVKIKDQAAAQRILDLMVRLSKKERERFVPVEIDGLKGVSIQRKDGKNAEIEPTFVINGDRIVFSLVSPMGIKRALAAKHPGPASIMLDDAGAGKLVGEKTNTVFVADLASVLQLGYNIIDFVQHSERMYPVLNFKTLPTEIGLDKYLSPVVIVSDSDPEQGIMCSTMVSPSGLVPGIISAVLVGNWADRAERYRRSEYQIKHAEKAMKELYRRLAEYKKQRGALPNSLAAIYTPGDDDNIFFFGGVKNNAFRAANLIENGDDRRFKLLHAFIYDQTADGNAEGILLTVKQQTIGYGAREYPVLRGNGKIEKITKAEYEEFLKGVMEKAVEAPQPLQPADVIGPEDF